MPGNPYRGLWFFASVLAWLFVGAFIYASYEASPEMASEDPLGTFAWVIIPALIALGGTWAWLDDVSWWREARRVASLIRWYRGGEVAFSKEVEASAGALILRSGMGYAHTAIPGKGRAVMEYEAVFTGPDEPTRGTRFSLPEETIRSAGLAYRGYYWLAAELPALLVRGGKNDVFVLVYDPEAIGQRTYRARADGVEVVAEVSGWGIRAWATGEPGKIVSAWLKCAYEGIEASIRVFDDEAVPINKEVQLAPRDPVVIVMARYMDEPRQVIKALNINESTAIGAALMNCELITRVK